MPLPYAVFGVRFKDDFVTAVAPIGKWMVGKHHSVIANWVYAKGGTVEKIKSEPTTRIL